MRISKHTLWIGIATILTFHTNLVTISSNYFPNYFNVRLLFATILAIMLFVKGKVFVKKEYMTFNLLLLTFCSIIIFSSFINRGIKGSFMMSSVVFAVGVFEFFLVAEYAKFSGKTVEFHKILYFCTLFYSIVADLSMIIIGGVQALTSTDTLPAYIFGNKFNLVYLNLFCLIMFYVSYYNGKRNRKILLVTHFVVVFFVARWLNSGTATLACCLFFILYFTQRWFAKIAIKPIVAVIAIFICNSLLLINSAILQIPAISYIITKLLNKSTDLTGRLDIFARIFGMISMSPWWGFGYDNNYSVSLLYVLAGNAQNGIFDCITSYGIIGTFFMILVLVFAIKRGGTKANTALYAILYAFIMLSMIEITLRLYFFVILALIAFDDNNRQSLSSNEIKHKVKLV